jgi:hypothetical protein
MMEIIALRTHESVQHRSENGAPLDVAWASRPLGRGHPARAFWRERDAPATAGETPALRYSVL